MRDNLFIYLLHLDFLRWLSLPVRRFHIKLREKPFSKSSSLLSLYLRRDLIPMRYEDRRYLSVHHSLPIDCVYPYKVLLYKLVKLKRSLDYLGTSHNHLLCHI